MSPKTTSKTKIAEQSEGHVAEVGPEEYARFVGQIDLDALWLVSARIENREGPVPPPSQEVSISVEPSYENRDGGFDAFVTYKLRFGYAELSAGRSEVEAKFGLRFSSAQPMTDELFKVFSNVNLPVNTWPFLREFVQSSAARMNWPPLTLPAFKVGTDHVEEEKPRRKRATPK